MSDGQRGESQEQHDWWDPGEKFPRLRVWQGDGTVLMSCKRCGIIKGAVSVTRPCPGPVPVTLRAAEGPDIGRHLEHDTADGEAR